MYTPDAASSKSGACVVCGKETIQVCSQCNRSGIDWMYFCGVEHQRSVWSLHKRVCGKNPFTFPALSDAEADEIYEMRHDRAAKETEGPARPDSVTQMCFQMPHKRCLPTEILNGSDDVIFRALLDAAKEVNAVSSSHKAILMVVRWAAFSAKAIHVAKEIRNVATPTCDRHRVLAMSDPFGCMASVTGCPPSPAGDTFSLITGEAGWQSTFLHRLTLLVARLKRIDLESARRGPVRFVSHDENVSLDHMVSACAGLDSSSTSNMTHDARDWAHEILGSVLYIIGVTAMPR
ncbi:hypothetical protein JCM3766R1_002952 [Sporobolomyces carnicolor]